MNYNDGKVHTDFFDKPKEELDLIAKEFSEGNENLEELLKTLWSKKIKTSACCIGHKKSKSLFLNENTGEIIEKDNNLVSYISIVIDDESKNKIMPLITSMLEKYKDKIDVKISTNHALLKPVLSIHCDMDIKDDFFKSLSEAVKKDEQKNNLLIDFALDFEKKGNELFGAKKFYNLMGNDDKEYLNLQSGQTISLDYNKLKIISNIDDKILKDIWMEIIKINPCYIKFISSKSSNFKIVALEAIKINPYSISVLFDSRNEISCYIELALEAVKLDNSNIKFLPYDYIEYEKVAFNIIKTNPIILCIVDNRGIKDYDKFVLDLLKVDSSIFTYIDKEKIRDYDKFMDEVLKINPTLSKYINSVEQDNSNLTVTSNNYEEISTINVEQTESENKSLGIKLLHIASNIKSIFLNNKVKLHDSEELNTSSKKR